mmetsp:Transcript_12504/g.19353  ORF Transcript_12504/g.19353 Transcript_12504/m.19353 type:complete len:96 (-) Transcript_12504:253-540(-)
MENTNKSIQIDPKPDTGEVDRQTSVDSAVFFEAQDEYDDYDNFGATGGGGGNSKTNKRETNRGGGGSGTCYSSKHTRMKEVQRQNQKPKTPKQTK